MLFGIASQAGGVIAIGDSITVLSDSWAEQLRERGYRVKNMSQGARAARLYTLPSDLRKTPEFDRAVYFLGTNDMNIGFGYITSFEEMFNRQISLLSYGGLNPVVLMPPRYTGYEDKIDPIRAHLILICTYANLVCIDLEAIWDDSLTDGLTLLPDGIHPNSILSGLIADLVELELAR
ncbi:MAG: hypothetical protein ACI9JM_002037 [Halioglobus sp.]|jgi:hypothetical protein